jgi:hypothetical protein
VSVHCLLVGRRVEVDEELGSSEMEHELRENTEFRREPERCSIVLPVCGELSTQPNQGSEGAKSEERDAISEREVTGPEYPGVRS